LTYRLIGSALAVTAIVVLAIAFGAQEGDGRELVQSLILGAVLGIVLQRSRFCFLCHWRDFIEHRDPRGFVAILAALAVGTLGYLVLFGAWLPDPAIGRLPPDAHIGPAGPVLALAAFVFGVGMAVSGSCVSGHLYRLGEGSPTAPFALIGVVAGFVAGFNTWNALYVASVASAPVSWFPAGLGYTAWIFVQLGALAALALVVAALGRRPKRQVGNDDTSVLHNALRRILIDRGPAIVGGAAVGVIGTVAYFQVQPLGVTSAIGGVARSLSLAIGLLPETLHGLDGIAGCRTTVASLLTPNAALIVGLVLASLASALIAGQFKPAWPTATQVVRGALGGILLGWGAMTAIGCTVGTLLSGTMAGAASGWMFFAASFAGVYASLCVARAGRSLFAAQLIARADEPRAPSLPLAKTAGP
jgi:uncharacterized membrane protein YedE/YeeE